AARASRDATAMRGETGNCAGRTSSQIVARARANAPADGLLSAAQGDNDTGAPASLAPSIYGSLDLGTNNCRLLIAKPSRRSFLVIDAFSRIIRLGEGVLSSGRLSDTPMSRHIDTLH